MNMNLLSRIYILVLFNFEVTYAVDIVKFSLSDGMVPEKGSDISMSCDYDEITSGDGIQAMNIIKREVRVASCFLYVGGTLPCSKEAGVSARYIFTKNHSSVIISITNLQITDGGTWKCGFASSTGYTLYTLPVYSSPVSIVLSGSSEPEDLSVKGVNITCKTFNCVYPAPGYMHWFYKKENSSSWLPYQNLSTSPMHSSCSGSENIYSSTLNLTKYSTWPFQPTNTDVTVKIQCRLDFPPTLKSPLVSTDSNDVRYAVQVTSAIIYVESSVAVSPLQVYSGEGITLTCHTSVSRPAATIVWYIGSEKKQTSSSPSFTFNPEISDDNNTVYCKAFNIQSETKAVASNIVTLRVKERTSVKSFYIGQNESKTNATFEEHDSGIVLTCVVGGYPASNVDISFGGNILTRSSDTNILKYTFQDISCTSAGDYICTSIDDEGKSTTKTVSVSVECAPRPFRQVLQNITSELGVPVNLSFMAIAYPEPGPKGFTWYKEDRSIWISLLSNADFKISSSGLETNLTIRNVSDEYFGKYRITVMNTIGTYSQIVYLSEKAGKSVSSCSCICTEKNSYTLSIILGVVCIVVISYAAGLTIVFKRNIYKKGPTSISESEAKKSTGTVSAETDRNAEQYDGVTTEEDSSKQYTELTQYRNVQTTYECLQI